MTDIGLRAPVEHREQWGKHPSGTDYPGVDYPRTVPWEYRRETRPHEPSRKEEARQEHHYRPEPEEKKPRKDENIIEREVAAISEKGHAPVPKVRTVRTIKGYHGSHYSSGWGRAVSARQALTGGSSWKKVQEAEITVGRRAKGGEPSPYTVHAARHEAGHHVHLHQTLAEHGVEQGIGKYASKNKSIEHEKIAWKFADERAREVYGRRPPQLGWQKAAALSTYQRKSGGAYVYYSKEGKGWIQSKDPQRVRDFMRADQMRRTA
jgi:hypothetical protein